MSPKYRRHSIRLKDYDYSKPGAYFITICTKDRKCLFGEIKDNQMVLNEFGQIAKDVWLEIPHHFPNVELDEFVIMPNHVHGIIIINDNDAGMNNNPNEMNVKTNVGINNPNKMNGKKTVGAIHELPLQMSTNELSPKSSNNELPAKSPNHDLTIGKNDNSKKTNNGSIDGANNNSNETNVKKTVGTNNDYNEMDGQTIVGAIHELPLQMSTNELSQQLPNNELPQQLTNNELPAQSPNNDLTIGKNDNSNKTNDGSIDGTNDNPKEMNVKTTVGTNDNYNEMNGKKTVWAIHELPLQMSMNELSPKSPNNELPLQMSMNEFSPKLQNNDLSDVTNNVPNKTNNGSINGTNDNSNEMNVETNVGTNDNYNEMNGKKTVWAIHELPLQMSTNELSKQLPNNELPLQMSNNELSQQLPNNELSQQLTNNELPQNDNKIQRRKMIVPKIVGFFKMNTAKKINQILNTMGQPVWQRNYYEHIIRDEESLQRIRQYIINNPANWNMDTEYYNEINNGEII